MMHSRRFVLAAGLAQSILVVLAGSIAIGGDGSPHIYPEHQDLSYYLDADRTRHAIHSPADWMIRLSHIRANMELVMGPLPRPTQTIPLDVRIREQVPIGVLIRRKVDYHTDSPTRRVSAYLFLPADASTRRPAILCLHQTIKIGKEEPAGLGTNPDLRYALELAQRGYVTLAPDYPSFGEYAYDFDPKDGYVSGTMKAIYDNMRAIDLLQSLPDVDRERIGCIGHSLGGHNSIFTAVFDGRIKAVVSNCGFTRFHKYYGGNLKGWTSARYMPRIATVYGSNPDRVPFDFTELIAALAPRPFLASAPIHDENFEVSGVRDVIEAAKPIYALYGKEDNLAANYPDCHHAFPPAAREVAYSFLDRHLK